MRVLICGGRDFEDLDFMVERLLRLHGQYQFTDVITGGARGADTVGHEFAVELGLRTHVYMADWKAHGLGAGPKRNQLMLDEGDPNLVVAFPGGKGTEDMVRRSMRHGVPVWQSKMILFNSSSPTHKFLSNFAQGFEFVDADGCIWATSEHYYQSRKTDDEEIRGMIQGLANPGDAKRAGKLLDSEEWSDRKLDVMRETLGLKFKPDSDAAQLLLETNEDYLREYAPWGDQFWGTDGVHGQNHLGRLLMERRDILNGM